MRLLATLLPLTLLPLLLGSSCKKEKVAPQAQLPPATTSGANTWGCLVNGEVWTASGRDHVRADWTTPDGLSASIGCAVKINGSTEYNGVLLSFPDTTLHYSLQAGIYTLTPPPGNAAILQKLGRLIRASSLLKGKVILTRLDRQAGIMSGTFEFTTVAAPGDTLRVTQGRFDIGQMDL